MKNNRGFTLVELLVSMMIVGFLMLTVIYIASISRNSYEKILDETSIFDDIAYGFKLLQNRFHTADEVKAIDGDGNFFVTGSRVLNVAETKTVNNITKTYNRKFGLSNYQAGTLIYFGYLPDQVNDVEKQMEKIFSVASTSGNITFEFCKPLNPSLNLEECIPNDADLDKRCCSFGTSDQWVVGKTDSLTDVVKVRLEGEKNKIPFKMETIIKRRL